MRTYTIHRDDKTPVQVNAEDYTTNDNGDLLLWMRGDETPTAFFCSWQWGYFTTAPVETETKPTQIGTAYVNIEPTINPEKLHDLISDSVNKLTSAFAPRIVTAENSALQGDQTPNHG